MMTKYQVLRCMAGIVQIRIFCRSALREGSLFFITAVKNRSSGPQLLLLFSLNV